MPPRPGGALRAPAPAPERRLRGVPARAGADRARQPPPRSAGPRARGRRDDRAARVLPARRRARPRSSAGDTVAILGAGPIGLMLCACVADAGGAAGGGRRPARAAGARAAVRRRAGRRPGRRRRDRGRRHQRGVARCARASSAPGGTVLFFGGREVAVDTFRLHYEELTLRGAFHHTPRTVRRALAFLASGARPWERLITHEVGARGRAGPVRRPAARPAEGGRPAVTSVAVLGATGFVGRALVPELARAGTTSSAVSRSGTRADRRRGAGRRRRRGRRRAGRAARSTAWRSSTTSSTRSARADFADLDRRAAENVAREAERAGVRQIVYLGGLGDDRADLSAHLRSRLRDGGRARVGLRSGDDAARRGRRRPRQRGVRDRSSPSSTGSRR